MASKHTAMALAQLPCLHQECGSSQPRGHSHQLHISTRKQGSHYEQGQNVYTWTPQKMAVVASYILLLKGCRAGSSPLYRGTIIYSLNPLQMGVQDASYFIILQTTSLHKIFTFVNHPLGYILRTELLHQKVPKYWENCSLKKSTSTYTCIYGVFFFSNENVCFPVTLSIQKKSLFVLYFKTLPLPSLWFIF